MCARAIDMRGEGERRGPSAELHRYRLDGRSSMGPCRRRWRKYKSSASGGNGAGRGGALLLESSAPSTYFMSTTFTVLKFNGPLKLVAYLVVKKANSADRERGGGGRGAVVLWGEPHGVRAGHLLAVQFEIL